MLRTMLLLAGLGQLLLAVGSLAIPRMLRWSEDLARVRPLTRQVFWTYAGYIWVTNVCFGLLSLLAPAALCDGSTLAGAVSGFIACYWLARLLIQFLYFDRSAAPTGPIFRLAEVTLVGLFLALTFVYGWALAVNLGALTA
jgi:hypothetical protein